MSEFARLLRETIETNAERYIADLRVARAHPNMARFGPDDIDYGRGVYHVLERMTGIAEGTLRAPTKPLSDLDITGITHRLHVDPSALLGAAYAERTTEHRIADAADVIAKYGMTDGAHHKQWVLDQAVRAMLGPVGYAAWLAEQNSDPDYAPWDTGIAP